jgi:hypothetical protein
MTETKIKIDLPEYIGTEHTIVDGHIIFVSIEHDSDSPNPCEDMDGFGMIRSFSNRHHNNINPNEALEMMKADPDIVGLSYFEHGNSMWFVKGEQPAGVEFQWDGTRFAGIWIPDKCVKDSYTTVEGKTRAQYMEEQASSACTTYTQWCNGEIYYYNVEAFKLRTSEDGDMYDEKDDYRYEKALFDDSCCGMYGIDYVKGEAEGAAQSAVEKIHERLSPKKRKAKKK